MYLLTHVFFTKNIMTVFFLYGLSAFILGLAIFLKKRPIKLELVKALPWLSAFGFIHAAHEWLEMYEVIYPKFQFSAAFHIVLLLTEAISSFCILTFGILLIFYLKKNKKIFIIYVSIVVIWLFFVFFLYKPNIISWAEDAQIISRYLFYFTGAILTGIALILEYQEIQKIREFKISRNFIYAAILFFISAPFIGIISESGSFFPSDFLNVKTFLLITGFPIQLFRGLIFILITFFIIRGLDIFEVAEEQKLKELRDRERAALDKSERLTKQYSLLYQRQKNISHTLQKALLPASVPRIENYNIGIHYRSATVEAAIGGDFYDFIKAKDNSLFLIIGDVSGKGIKAATDIANVKSILRYLLLSENNLSKVMASLNNALFKEYKASKFFTGILIFYDNNKKEVSFVNAGHPAPLIYNKQKDIYTWKRKSSAALAIISDEQYRIVTLKDNESDLLVFFTDGLTDARRDHKFFGEKEVRHAVKDLKNQSAQEIADNLAMLALNFSGNVLFDDLLILTMKKR